MEYKKIIRSRAVRSKILRALSFIPDEPMLRLQYYMKMNRPLNLNNPKRYTEKLQWYKLHYRDPKMIPCVDKYDVRDYVRGVGLERILTKCYGVYERVEDVDFDALPNRFVLKDTLGGGGNSVIIVKDKSQLDVPAVKSRMQKWVDSPHTIRGGGREWPYYSGKKHRIYIEEYLPADDSEIGLVDYKFFCFGGKIACVYFIGNRTLGEHGELAVLDEKYCRMPIQSLTQGVLKSLPEKPECWEEMCSTARQLSAGFPHVRVDLFLNRGGLYFGELTFFGASGYQKYEPDAFDLTLGKWFVLPEQNH